MREFSIAAIPADGIGPEVIDAGVTVLDALQKRLGDVRFNVTHFDWGSDYYRKHGVMMPADGLEKLKKFEAAQSELSGSLSRLLVVAEPYPQLKATDAYRDLQSQLEGTENRIAVARRRYIESVAEYNGLVQRFPTSIGASMRGRNVRPTFEAAPGSDKAPEIKL